MKIRRNNETPRCTEIQRGFTVLFLFAFDLIESEQANDSITSRGNYRGLDSKFPAGQGKIIRFQHICKQYKFTRLIEHADDAA